MGKVTVIGIAGCTRSGKSTVTKLLSQKLNNSHVVQTDRFWAAQKPKHKTGYTNWECPAAVNYESVHSHLVDLIQSLKKRETEEEQFVIIEGFLLFNYEPIVKLCDKKIYLFLSKQTCFNRRMSTTPVPPLYFEELVWPEFIEYNKAFAHEHETKYSDFMFLNAERDLQSVERLVLDFIHQSEPKPAICDVEEFHRILKQGNCDIEVAAFEAIIKELEALGDPEEQEAKMDALYMEEHQTMQL